MDSSTRNEINSIISELKSIQSGLYNVSNDIRKNINGLNENECADAIDSVAAKCGKAITNLYHI